jgi:hypothetical protein
LLGVPREQKKIVLVILQQWLKVNIRAYCQSEHNPQNTSCVDLFCTTCLGRFGHYQVEITQHNGEYRDGRLPFTVN